jgi:hypothetical protein
MGSSDQVAFVNAGPDNRCYLLFHAHEAGELIVDGKPQEPQARAPDEKEQRTGSSRTPAFARYSS